MLVTSGLVDDGLPGGMRDEMNVRPVPLHAVTIRLLKATGQAPVTTLTGGATGGAS